MVNLYTDPPTPLIDASSSFDDKLVDSYVNNVNDNGEKKTPQWGDGCHIGLIFHQPIEYPPPPLPKHPLP